MRSRLAARPSRVDDGRSCARCSAGGVVRFGDAALDDGQEMLRLAKRWGYVAEAPDVNMPRKPEARQRYLEEEEIPALAGCLRRSRNPHRAAIVTIAVNTGMRKSEILGLAFRRSADRAWEQIRTALRDGVRPSRDQGLPFPRSQAHGREPHGHAGRQPEGRAGDPRPLGLQDDPALRSPQPEPPPGRRGSAGRAHDQHNVSTKRGRIASASRKCACPRSSGG